MEISIEKTIEIFQGMKKGISPWYPEEYYNFAIDIMRKYQKIEQIKNDSLYDIYMAGVNMTGEYQGCWVRFKDIENIVNEHFSGGLDKNSQKLELQEQEPKPMREAVAVLEELDLQIDKIGISTSISREDIYWSMGAKAMRKEIKLLIQQQINTLKGN